MRWTLIILSFCWCSYGYSQSTTLHILGRTSYTSYPQSYIYKIHNVEYAHSAGHFNNLKFRLDSLGVIFRIDSIQNAWMDNTTTISYSTYSLSHFELLKEQCRLLDMHGEEEFVYVNEDFRYQDTLAMLAYQDALKRAKIMAQYLGKKIARIQSIDDHVERYLFYLNVFPEGRYNIDQLKEVIQFMEFLSVIDPPKSAPERTGQYALWVKFELK